MCVCVCVCVCVYLFANSRQMMLISIHGGALDCTQNVIRFWGHRWLPVWHYIGHHNCALLQMSLGLYRFLSLNGKQHHENMWLSRRSIIPYGCLSWRSKVRGSNPCLFPASGGQARAAALTITGMKKRGWRRSRADENWIWEARKKTVWVEDSFRIGACEADMVWNLSYVFSLTLSAD